MYKLIEFIRNTYVIVLFVLFEAITIGHYARSTHHTRARLLAKATQVVGAGHEALAGVRKYFRLERENRELLEYSASLQERLACYEASDEAPVQTEPPLLRAAEHSTAADGADSLRMHRFEEVSPILGDGQYRTSTAAVISNTINKSENFIVLNRGISDGVKREMAVLSSGGAIVGYVVDCTERYAVVLSILSSSFRTGGKLSDSGYFGQIYWDGTDQHTVLLGDLSKYADPQPGQEVVTTGSLFFPDGIAIGRVIDAQLDETGTTYTARVELAARLSGLSHVVLVENRDIDEIQQLLKSDKTHP